MPLSPDTRAAILRVALDLFRTQGYDATSLRQIAERLDITKAAVYYHFRAKEQLVVELTKPFLDGLGAIIAEARARDGETPMKADELLGRYLDHMVAQHDVVNVLAGDPAMTNHPDVGMRATVLLRSLQSELVGPEATEADRVRAWCAIGAVNAAAAVPGEAVDRARGPVLRAALAALRSGDANPGDEDFGDEA